MGISEGVNTVASAPAVKGEALEDSFLDMGNYGPIGVMLARGWWPRVRPEDVWIVDGKDRIVNDSDQRVQVI